MIRLVLVDHMWLAKKFDNPEEALADATTLMDYGDVVMLADHEYILDNAGIAYEYEDQSAA